MKDLKRSGWIMRNVTQPESDADHSFGVALLTMMLAPKKLNKQKCIELALIHDLAEIYAGDFTPHDNISPQNKEKLEREGALRLSQELNWPELTDMVAEYNDKKTPEAVFVCLIDKLETLMTAKYYDNNNRSSDKLTNEFSAYAKRYIQQFDDCEIKSLFDNL